jgi:hypothetical protein
LDPVLESPSSSCLPSKLMLRVHPEGHCDNENMNTENNEALDDNSPELYSYELKIGQKLVIKIGHKLAKLGRVRRIFFDCTCI